MLNVKRGNKSEKIKRIQSVVYVYTQNSLIKCERLLLLLIFVLFLVVFIVNGEWRPDVIIKSYTNKLQ